MKQMREFTYNLGIAAVARETLSRVPICGGLLKYTVYILHQLSVFLTKLSRECNYTKLGCQITNLQGDTFSNQFLHSTMLAFHS